MKKRPVIVVSTGAGVSAESGIPTYRDSNGLWENYPVMDVASADGFARNPELIHSFYNMLRKKYINHLPNDAHKALAELEKDYDVYIITQNVDNLHEKAGSSNVLHLHGELMKIRSITHPDYKESLDIDRLETTPETRGANGDYMRPDIVFFQEAVPNIEPAIEIVKKADIFVVIGTSLVVYPAAGLINYVRPDVPIYYIDPRPADVSMLKNVNVIKDKASSGMKKLAETLQKECSNNQDT